jgi:hypothetical protein
VAPGVPSPKGLADSAAELAREHREAGVGPGDPRVWRRAFARSAADLVRTYDLLARASAAGAELSPGGHWILDNFYIVRDQRAEVHRHLRGSFFRELPHLQTGPAQGHPRVFDLAARVVDLLDGAITGPELVAFLHAYQAETPLKLGELWAIPDLLRVAL